MKELFELMNPDNTISVNRMLAHTIGLCESVMYHALLAKYAWYEKNGALHEDGWFYSTVADMEESTSLSSKQQRRCIEKLTELGLIRSQQKGIPAKRYFFIEDNVQLLKRLISGEYAGEITPDKREEQEMPKGNNKALPSGTTSRAETEYKTKVNKTKTTKPKQVNQNAWEQLCCGRLSQQYGEPFAELAADILSDGLEGKIGLTVDGRTVTNEEVMSAYSLADYETVSHIADYIAGNGKIRSIDAYLRKALYISALERSRRPAAQSPSHPSSIDMDDVMAELRAQYGGA